MKQRTWAKYALNSLIMVRSLQCSRTGQIYAQAACVRTGEHIQGVCSSRAQRDRTQHGAVAAQTVADDEVAPVRVQDGHPYAAAGKCGVRGVCTYLLSSRP